MSIAHDEADGAGLFVITDRPCYVSGSPFNLPLAIDGAGGAPLAVLSAAQAEASVKFRLGMSGPVPRGQRGAGGRRGPAGRTSWTRSPAMP